MNSTISNMLQLVHNFPHGLCRKLVALTLEEVLVLCRDSPWGKCPEIRSPWTLLWSSLAYLRRHITRQLLVELQGRKTPTIKRWGQRSSGVQSCDQPSSVTLSLEDNMACRHQSQWQLLISPLHKCQEIIRMDQFTRICVCLCVCVYIRGPPEISWILISLKGKGGCGWIAMHLHLHECAFSRHLVMKEWLTDRPRALWSPA